MGEEKKIITDKEAYVSLLNKKPIWQITYAESRMFNPSVIPDVSARAFIIEAGVTPRSRGGLGGKDMFGLEWVYDAAAGGSLVAPGSALFDDVNEWEEKVVWPDVTSWDWAGNAEKNKDFLSEDKFNIMPFMTGWYERLMSMMGFENAVVALIDEDQEDAIHAFFDKLTDTYIDIFDLAIKTFPKIDGFWIHGRHKISMIQLHYTKSMVIRLLLV